MIFISTTCFDFDFLENPSIPLKHEILNIELSGGGVFHENEYIKALLSDFLKNENTHIRVHNYFPVPRESFIMNFSSSDASQIDNSLTLTKSALKLCSEFSVPYYSFHPGYLAQAGIANRKGHFDFESNSFIDYDTALKNFFSNFVKIRALADEFEIKLAVENLFPRFGKIDSLNNNFEEFDAILTTLPDGTGILLDLGHLNVSSSALKFDRFDYLNRMIDKYGERIFEIHISGNDGSDDQHLPVSNDDWQLEALQLFEKLPGSSGNGIDVTLEARNLNSNVLKKNIEILTRI